MFTTKNSFKIKKSLIFLILILFLFLFVIIKLFADETDTKKGYILYEERVENICKPYKPEKTIFKVKDDYIDISSEGTSLIGNNYFLNAKKMYKKNMNNIYKCMIINSQIKSLGLVRDDLIKNNPDLNKEIKGKIDKKIKKLEFSFNTLKCSYISEENDSVQKLALLRQTTYELCKYHSYLEYLREYNSDYKNLLIEDKDYDTDYVVNLEQTRKNEIDNEINHIYKIYPIAFDAYNQYENNVTIHILLELIKEDYLVFREALYKSTNPINQVVYKISNAMNLD